MLRHLTISLVAGAALGLSMAWPHLACAQAYPAKPIRVIVDTAAGGVVDIWARRIAQHMTTSFKQSVIVDNRPGASGTIAAEAVANAPPDGYTALFAGVNSLVTFPSSGGVVRYDPVGSFIPVAGGTQGYPQLLANSSLNIRSLADLTDFARKQPQGVTCATSGNASFQHFACELTARALGIRLRVIPYKASAPALQDVASGQVQLAVGFAAEIDGLVTSGRLTPIAIFGPKRLPKSPSVPTFEEAGHSNMSLPSFNGFYLPARTPVEIVEQLNAASIAALQSPELQEIMRTLGATYIPYKPSEFADFVHGEQMRWKRRSDDMGIKAEQ